MCRGQCVLDLAMVLVGCCYEFSTNKLRFLFVCVWCLLLVLFNLILRSQMGLSRGGARWLSRGLSLSVFLCFRLLFAASCTECCHCLRFWCRFGH